MPFLTVLIVSQVMFLWPLNVFVGHALYRYLFCQQCFAEPLLQQLSITLGNENSRIDISFRFYCCFCMKLGIHHNEPTELCNSHVKLRLGTEVGIGDCSKARNCGRHRFIVYPISPSLKVSQQSYEADIFLSCLSVIAINTSLLEFEKINL